MMPRSRSSGALSICRSRGSRASPRNASVLVIAAVSVVLPWSTCPIVPTLTCGLFRSKFCLPTVGSSYSTVLIKNGWRSRSHG